MTRNVDDALLSEFPLPPIRGGSKEARGRIAIVGGDVRVPGAALLAATAAMRAGAGRLQLAVPREVAVATAIAMPEAMVVPFDDAHSIVTDNDAVIIGPGMFSSDETRDFVLAVLPHVTSPVVLDSGAFCALKARPHATRAEPVRAVITPHSGEMAFLMDSSREDVMRDSEDAARNAAERFGTVCVLKGETTYVAVSRGECFVHSGGSAGLATSGSGDTLAGIIGALLARGASPSAAALWGVAVHAKAGRNLESRIGVGFLAREICDELPGLLNASLEVHSEALHGN